MFYEPSKNDHGLERNPFKSCTVPRVIGWISTRNEDGSDNLSPYSQFTNLTFDPPLVMLSANQNVFGDRKTTVKNIERTGEFVYNMVSYDLREEMNRSSIVEIPEGFKDKFDYAGVTKSESKIVDVGIHIADNAINEEGRVDIQNIKPVARLGYFDFTYVDNSFEMAPPKISPDKQALVDKGLEGKV